MPITDLTGVLIHTTTERHATMRDFYVHVLGLTPRSDRSGFVNFEFGARRLTIALHDDVEGSTRDPFRIMINFEVEDIDGNVFVDFCAGIAVNSTGHSHPAVIGAIKDQADELVHYSASDFFPPIYASTCQAIAETTRVEYDPDLPSRVV